MAENVIFAQPPAVSSLLARGVVPRRRPAARAGLPDRVLRIPAYRPRVERVAAYARVCGFGLTDAVPATWVHVLAFPLQTALMAEPDFPFAPAGLVHLRNTMTLHRPVMVTDTLDLLVRPGAIRPHPKGQAFDLVSEARVGSELAWSGVSTYLARGASTAAEPADPDRPPETGDWPRPSQTWRLPATLGRQYAAVSGDINPIHLSAATARLFGYPKPIAHGMWTHARALAALGHLPRTYTTSVAFRRPILLPTSVGFTVEGADFAVLGRTGREGPGKELLTGSLTPA